MKTLEDDVHMQILLGFGPAPAETTAVLPCCLDQAQGLHSWILSLMWAGLVLTRSQCCRDPASLHACMCKAKLPSWIPYFIGGELKKCKVPELHGSRGSPSCRVSILYTFRGVLR